jgi:hypothetical protein
MNVLIVGFNNDGVVPALRQLNPAWKIVWIGLNKDKAEGRNPDFLWHDLQYGKICEQPYSGAYTDRYSVVLEKFVTYMRSMTRVSGDGWLDWTFQDYIDLFNLHYDFFANLFEVHQFDVVLFPACPHDGFDVMPYLLAQALGIKTLMINQSIFPNRLYCVTHIESHGLFNDMPFFNEPSPYPIKKRDFVRPFYTPAKPKPPYEVKKVLPQLIKLIREKGPARLLQRYYRLKAYQRDIAARYVKTQIDFIQPYVYFPLHMQPEMTTCSIGKMYDDQMLAIERLSKIIPADWLIYVKSHHIQTEAYRGRLFFKRMDRISNIRFIHPSVNTFDLIEHSQFVATITGTAGWEAITSGKNVLIFGCAWYRTLPGVFEYDNGVTVAKIKANTINHEELEKRVGELVAQMLPGIVEHAYAAIYPAFDRAENIKTTVQSLTRFVNHFSLVKPSPTV